MLHDNRIADIIDVTCSKNGRCKVEIVQMEIRKSFFIKTDLLPYFTRDKQAHAVDRNHRWKFDPIGIFKTAFENTLPDESLQFYDYIFEQMKKNSYVCPEPELMLFTIIELVGSTCYSCILYGQPVSVEEYLPYLHTVIRQILAGFLVQQPAQIETKTAS